MCKDTKRSTKILFPKADSAEICYLSLLQVGVLVESHHITFVIMLSSFTESEGDPAVDTDEGSLHCNRSW